MDYESIIVLQIEQNVSWRGDERRFYRTRSNRVLKMQSESKTLEEYWWAAMVMFPRLCETALAVIILLATTYLCA